MGNVESDAILLTIYAEVSDSESAAVFGQNLEAMLRDFGSVRAGRPEKYWKIPEYYGFSYWMDCGTSPLERFDRLVLSFNPGTVVREPDAFALYAVWAAGDPPQFLDARVKWAHFEVVFAARRTSGHLFSGTS